MKRLFTLVFALVLAASVSFAAEKKAAPAPAPATAPAKAPAPAVEKKAEAAPAAKAELVDINTATEAELKAVPGIGDEYSKKIIAGRPFSNKSQLLSKKIVPKDVYEKIKDLVIAKKVKMAK